MGVEYEYLQDLNEAMNAINQASTIAKLHLGKDNYTHLTTKIEESKSKIMELKKRANSRIHSLRAVRRITKGSNPQSNRRNIANDVQNSVYSSNRINEKQYFPSQRAKICQTDVRSEFSGRHVHNVSEDKNQNLNQRIEKLPHLVQQDPINKINKGSNAMKNRSHNVSNKRRDNKEIAEKSSNEKNKRTNIDPHDMIFFHNPTLNTTPESLNYSSAVQVQGSSINQKVYATSKENKGKRQKLAQAINPKQRNQDAMSIKFLVNWDSHNQQIQQIYQQSFKRQNKISAKTNIQIGLYPSPYHSKILKSKGNPKYPGSKRNVLEGSTTPIKSRVFYTKTSGGERYNRESRKLSKSDETNIVNSSDHGSIRNEINIENHKSISANSTNYDKIQNSISKVKKMFCNVDLILKKFDDFSKECSDQIKQVDILEEDQILETKREYINGESDLESLLNCDNLSEISERS